MDDVDVLVRRALARYERKHEFGSAMTATEDELYEALFALNEVFEEIKR